MAGKARWSQVWWVDVGLNENKRFVVVSENGWNGIFDTVIAVRLTSSPNRDPGPGFPQISNKPRVIAVCGAVTTIHEDDLIEQVDHLGPQQMQAIAIGLLDVTQAHRLLGMQHPSVAPRVGAPHRGRPR